MAKREAKGNVACNGAEMAAVLTPPAHAKSAKVITEIHCSSILAADGTHNCGTERLDRPSSVQCPQTFKLSVRTCYKAALFWLQPQHTGAACAGQFNLENSGFPRNNATFSARASKIRALTREAMPFEDRWTDVLRPRPLGGKVLLSSSFSSWIESGQHSNALQQACSRSRTMETA